jgi:hypothetical protein
MKIIMHFKGFGLFPPQYLLGHDHALHTREPLPGAFVPPPVGTEGRERTISGAALTS